MLGLSSSACECFVVSCTFYYNGSEKVNLYSKIPVTREVPCILAILEPENYRSKGRGGQLPTLCFSFPSSLTKYEIPQFDGKSS